jgi:hypothetical protein
MATTFKQVKNNAKTYSAANALNNTTDVLTFAVDTGSKLSQPGNPFYVTAWRDKLYADPGDDPKARIGLVTARSGNNITVDWQGSITAIPGRVRIAMLLIDSHLNEIHAAINAAENDIDTVDATTVHITGAETVAGVKTFINSPLLPTPTTAAQAAPKSYMDSVLAAFRNQNSRSMSFDGSSYIDCGNDTSLRLGTASQPFTMAFFFKTPTVAPTTDQYIFAQEGRALARIGATMKLNAGVFGVLPTGDTTLALDTWYHGLVEFDGTNTINLYLNFALDKTSTASRTSSGTNNFFFGKRNGTANSEFRGKIDEVLYYNRVLTSGEKLDLQAGYIPATDALVSQWLFDEGYRANPLIAVDTVSGKNNGTITGATYSKDVYAPATAVPRDIKPLQSGMTIEQIEGIRTGQYITIGPVASSAKYIYDAATGIQAVMLLALAEQQTTGKAIFIMPGTYDQKGSVVYHDFNNVHIEAGPGTVTIKSFSASVTNMFEVGSSLGPTVLNNFTLKGIIWDMNFSALWGVNLPWCDDVLIQDCRVINPKAGGRAMMLLGKFGGGSDAFEAQNIRMVNSVIDYSTATGLTWEMVGAINAKDISFEGCRIYGNGSSLPGILGYNSEQIRYSNTYFYRSKIVAGGRGLTSIMGCHIDNSHIYGDEAENLYIGGGTLIRAFGDLANLSVAISFQGGYKTSTDPETPWYINSQNIETAAVDTSGDTITLPTDTLHPTTNMFATGTPVKLTTTGTLPAPLVVGTTYYSIRVNDTQIKLATTAANAAGGTAIDLTTQGTVRHTIKVAYLENFAAAAVDPGTDQITLPTTTLFPTATPIKYSVSGGTLPAPLVANTLYYVINVDATHIKLATSAVNAGAGTAIDLTTAGTGTHTIAIDPTPIDYVASCKNVVIDGVIIKGYKDNAIRAKTTTEAGHETLDVRNMSINNVMIEDGVGIPIIAFAETLTIDNVEIRNGNIENAPTKSYHLYIAAREAYIGNVYTSSPNITTDIVVDLERFTHLLPNMKLRLRDNKLNSATKIKYYDAAGVLQTSPTANVTLIGIPVDEGGTGATTVDGARTNFRLGINQTPASAAATGVAGTIAWDSNYIYVCVATDTWKRVAIATW